MTTPQQIIDEVTKAEQILYKLIKSHPVHCGCDLCRLWRRTYAEFRTLMRPGWESKGQCD